MKTTLGAATLVLLSGTLGVAHRLDEYLQGTIISIEKSRVNVEITLTPGVAVFLFFSPLLTATGTESFRQ